MAGCDHLRDRAEAAPDARSAAGCEECLRDGTRWVHLRLCVDCGHVGCCDSSQMRHAAAHAREATHPVAASNEPGETWRWCYVDEVMSA